MMKQLKRYTINMMMQTKKLYVIAALAGLGLVIYLYPRKASNNFNDVELYKYQKNYKYIINNFESFDSKLKKSGKYRIYHGTKDDFEVDFCRLKINELCESEISFNSIEIFNDSIVVYYIDYFHRPFESSYDHFIVMDHNNYYFGSSRYVTDREKKYLRVKALDSTTYYIINRYKDLTEN